MSGVIGLSEIPGTGESELLLADFKYGDDRAGGQCEIAREMRGEEALAPFPNRAFNRGACMLTDVLDEVETATVNVSSATAEALTVGCAAENAALDHSLQCVAEVHDTIRDERGDINSTFTLYAFSGQREVRGELERVYWAPDSLDGGTPYDEANPTSVPVGLPFRKHDDLTVLRGWFLGSWWEYEAGNRGDGQSGTHGRLADRWQLSSFDILQLNPYYNYFETGRGQFVRGSMLPLNASDVQVSLLGPCNSESGRSFSALLREVEDFKSGTLKRESDSAPFVTVTALGNTTRHVVEFSQAQRLASSMNQAERPGGTPVLPTSNLVLDAINMIDPLGDGGLTIRVEDTENPIDGRTGPSWFSDTYGPGGFRETAFSSRWFQ